MRGQERRRKLGRNGKGVKNEKAAPNRYRCAVPGNRGSTSRQRLRAPLPNLLLRKPILLPLPALVFRTRALPTKPIRQDKRPQQEQSRRHATRFRSRVPGCARSWCCRRGHEIIWLPRMTRVSKRVTLEGGYNPNTGFWL